MNLDPNMWKEFKVSEILTIYNGKGITQEEIEENPGSFPVVQSGEEDNGVLGYINYEYCVKMGYTVSIEECLTVARSGSAGFVSYQANGCVVGDSAKILKLRIKERASIYIYLFIKTLLMENKYKYTYGRKVTEEKYSDEVLRLPVKDGLPDWDYMEEYIKSLSCKRLTTSRNIGDALKLNVGMWKFFYLKDLCKIMMGNKMDYTNMTFEMPAVNFVGRSADDEGVAGKVDLVYDINGNVICPYKAGLITVALGGSLGSAYVQTEDFYTSQNVSVLEFDEGISVKTKLFITTCIMNECKYKYYPFGRELNTHIRKDFGFTLPVVIDDNGNPEIDSSKRFCDEGYIPDWEAMEDYISMLPYGDRL